VREIFFECPKFAQLRRETNEMVGNFCHIVGLKDYRFERLSNEVTQLHQRVEWLINRITELEGGDNGAG
jgi:hypothetical protein